MCPLAPPSVNACQDTSHPYYDVARHGILQVTGNNLVCLCLFFIALPQNLHSFPNIIAVFANLVSFNDKGQGFPGLVSMHHWDSSVDKMCLRWMKVFDGKKRFYLAFECSRDDIFHVPLYISFRSVSNKMLLAAYFHNYTRLHVDSS